MYPQPKGKVSSTALLVVSQVKLLPQSFLVFLFSLPLILCLSFPPSFASCFNKFYYPDTEIRAKLPSKRYFVILPDVMRKGTGHAMGAT